MGRSRSFNNGKRSKKQQGQLNAVRAGPPKPLPRKTTSRSIRPLLCPLTPKTQRIAHLELWVSDLSKRTASFKLERRNLQRRLVRSTKHISVFKSLQKTQHTLPIDSLSSRHPLLSETPLVNSESATTGGGPGAPNSNFSASSPEFPALQRLRNQVVQLRKDKDALRKRLARKEASHGKDIEKAVLAAEESLEGNAGTQYFIKHKGTVTPKTRALIRSLVALKIPFENAMQAVIRVLSAAGIEVVGSFSRRTASRTNKESGVLSKVQLAHELKKAKTFTIKSDVTTFKGVTYEAAFAVIPTPSYNPSYGTADTPGHSVRAFAVHTAIGHTSPEQCDNWKGCSTDILDVYNASPLGQLEPLTMAELLGKLKGFHSDHANDQLALATLLEEWKVDVDRQARGKAHLSSLPLADVLRMEARRRRLRGRDGAETQYNLLGDRALKLIPARFATWGWTHFEPALPLPTVKV
ncbi:hypothetical protein EUX98_g3646 [Antrodiella citrinella]|uniref:Uncharacterized protein n=1 Tax=Antrodiella citrinella TaxID=2447956 RepID=A0A4S4MW25_9APHY|nr:hypothetical protein EUX98_g3646 [Antrodiella citrinella]